MRLAVAPHALASCSSSCDLSTTRRTINIVLQLRLLGDDSAPRTIDRPRPESQSLLLSRGKRLLQSGLVSPNLSPRRTHLKPQLAPSPRPAILLPPRVSPRPSNPASNRPLATTSVRESDRFGSTLVPSLPLLLIPFPGLTCSSTNSPRSNAGSRARAHQSELAIFAQIAVRIFELPLQYHRKRK